MKRNLNNRFLLFPIGLLLLSCAEIVSQQTAISDSLKGVLFGIAIGVIALPVFQKKARSSTGR